MDIKETSNENNVFKRDNAIKKPTIYYYYIVWKYFVTKTHKHNDGIIKAH